MSDVSGLGPINPHDKKLYEQEYKQSADLFKRALDQYTKSQNPYQREEFKDVMDRAMHILNETARGLMRSELEKQNEEISKDYSVFQKSPENSDAAQKLGQDLDNAKKSV